MKACEFNKEIDIDNGIWWLKDKINSNFCQIKVNKVIFIKKKI